MTDIQFFEVGGCVRDEIMGVPSKDIDFSVIAPSFEAMEQAVIDHGMKVVQSKPEFGVIRAVSKRPFQGHSGGLDFVWARIDGPSSDGRRPDWTKPGSLMDDLARRDFTMNAIAKDAEGNIIDPFRGREAIRMRVIEAVGSAEDRLFEDALRGLRAMRFAVTKTMLIGADVHNVMITPAFADALRSVSKERQREEMEKMFSFATIEALEMLHKFPLIAEAVFRDGLRLSATMKEK